MLDSARSAAIMVIVLQDLAPAKAMGLKIHLHQRPTSTVFQLMDWIRVIPDYAVMPARMVIAQVVLVESPDLKYHTKLSFSFLDL